MEISLASDEERNAVYWRSRARESRETARRMISTGPRQGMLQIASIYEKLAVMAELDPLSRHYRMASGCRRGPRTVTVTSATEPAA